MVQGINEGGGALVNIIASVQPMEEITSNDCHQKFNAANFKNFKDVF